MSQEYGSLIKIFMKNPKKHRHLLKSMFYNPQTYLLAVPPEIFRQIWVPQIKTYGFFQATGKIYSSLSKFIESMQREPTSQLVSAQQAVMRMAVPLVATYGLDLRDSQEILTRIKTLKSQWKLQDSVCGGLVAYFESKLQKSDQQLQTLLSGILHLFNTTESKVDYQYWAVQMLHRSVGEALFQIDEGLQQLQTIYQDFIQYNKKRMVYLLDKLKTRPVTFCAILANLTLPANNQDSQSHLKHMLLLLLVFEYWNRFKHEESKLKEGSVISIISEAFHRMMYLLYNDDLQLSKALIFLLGQAEIGRCKPIIERVCYHLVAVYKLYSTNDQKELAKMVETLWKESFTEVKLNEIYLSFCPKFIAQSQKVTKSSLEECQTKSIMSLSCKSSELSFETSQKKSRGKSMGDTTSSNLRKWITAIQKELKLFNLQKVYLLLDGLKAFFDDQNRLLQDSLKQGTLKLLTTIVKKVEAKLKYRYNCKKLASGIYWQISCFSPIFYSKTFNYDAQVMGLGLFYLSSKTEGYINIQQIVQFHERYNYEENLHTVIHLKMLSEQISSHQNNNSLEVYEPMLKDTSFQGRLFKLFKLDFDGKHHDITKLIVIARLLSLKSNNVTNNILVNYVNYHFSSAVSEDKMTYIMKGLADLMNDEIKSRRDMDRVRLFLKMGTVFEEFYNRSRQISAIKYQKLVPELYFHFLMNPSNKEYFYLYSKTYQELYYIKQAIFFLELHCYIYEDDKKDEDIKKKAVKLYQQMNPAFSGSLKPILKYLHIEMNQTENNLVFESNQLDNLIQNSIKGIEYNFIQSTESQNFMGQQPSFMQWIQYCNSTLVFLIKTIGEKAESNRIQQSFMMLDIVTKMIGMKTLEITQQPSSTRNLVTNLIKKIECLNNGEIRLIFLRVLISQFPSLLKEKQLQKSYLETLLKAKSYSQFQGYLQCKRKEPNYGRAYLIYEIRVNFKQKRYPQTLAKIRDFLELKTNQHSSQINQLQLQCMYYTRLNFGIEFYLRNCNKAITKISSKDDKEAYFSYYFKIFRKLFQAYSFIKSTDNEMFLKVYINFLQASRVLTDNKQYIPEAVFYWLRFLLQKFYFAGNNLKGQFYAKEMVDYFRGHSKQFVPFCTYLIKKVSQNQERNGAIVTIMTEVLSENANECVWMISFLKNVDRGLSKKKVQPEDLQLNFSILSSICQKIYQYLLKNNVLQEAHLQYIDKLVDFALLDTEQKNIRAQGFKKIEIPPNLPFVFLPDYDIDKIRQVRTLSQGKSAPLQLSLTLRSSKTQNFKLVNVIIKGISPSQYRMQSNAANFFAQIGLMDKDITYRIFHLTRSLVMIEHVENVGTINALVSNHFPRFRQIQLSEQIKFRKYLKQNNLNTKQTLNLFDNLLVGSKERVKISQLIIKLSKSISQWWDRYTNFIRTHAHWSYIGYIVGLGDRHLDNILITEGFKLVHIDFEYILDVGFSLPYPQWVPFRLTHSLIEPLGLLGVFGLYYAEMIKIAQQFRKNEVNVWKALSNITGVYEKNLTQDILDRSEFKTLQKLSLEDGIASLIECATNPYLLRGMYIGFTPYI